MGYKYKKYIEENEEIRCGFKVSSNRKKVRNIQLGLLEEVKRICKKHGLRYYADSGTLLGAIRHKGFIPWDDDVDLLMFRKDYDKFLQIAKKELPNDIKLRKYYGGFSKIINMNTTAVGNENRWDIDFVGGIRIDIFPMDYASKYIVINQIKSIILRFLGMILISQKSDKLIETAPSRKKILLKISKVVFKGINCSKLCDIYEKISRKVFFKGGDIYTGWCSCLYYPENIFDKTHDTEFEKTTICIPDGYDKYLTMVYGDYMKPVIFDGGHSCRYSVKKSYKEIIKGFNKNKRNEENYNNCNDLFSI